MPDVACEAYRAHYQDAHEVIGSDFGDVVGVATLPVDTDFAGVPTGHLEVTPVRVYIMDASGDACGEGEGAHWGAYLTLEAAEELRDVLDAAINQVRWTRHERRVSPHA